MEKSYKTAHMFSRQYYGGSIIQMEWTATHVDYVAAAWAAGRSASKIAHELTKKYGVERTRGAVISKLNNMRLLGTNANAKPKAPRQRSTVADVLAGMANRSGKFGKTYALPPDEPIPATAVTLEHRQPNQCAWPVNHGGPWLYCGAHVPSARANAPARFCEHHKYLSLLEHEDERNAPTLDRPRIATEAREHVRKRHVRH